MRYLTFDIECCDGKHICEFGYVLYDEQFNVIERDCLLINPQNKFKLSGRSHESDIKLAFTEEEYYNSPTFEDRYEIIKRIITSPNCLIIGFSLSNDCGFLATAYELYNKEPIKFEYIDFQSMYKAYSKSQNRTSVENIVKELEIENITLHKSDDDSFAIMKALQKISQKENLSLPQTIETLRKINKDYKKEVARERNETLIEKINEGNDKAQREYLKRFIKRIENDKKTDNEFFNKKVVCINAGYQKDRFNEFLSLIRILYKNGATYSGKSSECDIFIKAYCDENDKRLLSVQEAKDKENKKIQIIELNESLELLKTTEKELASIRNLKEPKNTDRRQKTYFEGGGSASILEILKAKQK